MRYFKLLIILALICSMITIPLFFVEEVSSASTNQNYINEMVRLINLERSKNGLKPLEVNVNLVSPSNVRVNEISRLFSHTRPNGALCNSVHRDIHGENLAVGQLTPADAVNQLMNSRGHRDNILNPDFKSIGVAYLYDPNAYTVKTLSALNSNGSGISYKHYWSQLFSNFPAPTKPNVVPRFKASSIKNNKITLRWKDQTSNYIDGYKIYKYNPKTKKFRLIKVINNNRITSFTDSRLSSVTPHSYRIMAYKTGSYNGVVRTYNSDLSPVLTVITRPDRTKITSAHSSGKGISLRWKRVKKVDGYQIYKSSSKKGKYKLVGTAKRRNIVKFTDTNVSKNKRYNYKVRSYKKVGKKIVYSNFSKVRSQRA